MDDDFLFKLGLILMMDEVEEREARKAWKNPPTSITLPTRTRTTPRTTSTPEFRPYPKYFTRHARRPGACPRTHAPMADDAVYC